MNTVALSIAAQADLLDIREQLELHGISASMHYERLFSEAFAVLERFPLGGRERPDLPRRGLRSWPVSPYILIYRVRGTIVEVVRILHGARDLPNAL